MSTLSEKLLALIVDMEGECCPTCDEFNAKTLREAAEIIKRYEDAPVAELYHTRHERNQYYGELYAEDLPDGWEPAYTAIADGQRVRLVVEG